MRTDYNHAPTTRKRIREAAAESSSSWSLGEYAVSIRSDLRSAATSKSWISLSVAEGSSSWNLGEYAVSTRSDLRSTANYTKAPVKSETEAKPWRSQ